MWSETIVKNIHMKFRPIKNDGWRGCLEILEWNPNPGIRESLRPA
jgi:hypothetical protein